MLRDSVAAAGATGRLRIAAACAVAAIAVGGCGIKGPLRLPSTAPAPTPTTAPAPATAPTAPDAGSAPATEPDQAPPKKP
jgi:predicted small lipoprotein YifL